MDEKIIIAGSGGQGAMFFGKTLCMARMKEGAYVTYLPSYGAEVRGGTAYCHVVLSDRPIASPVIDTATAVVAMNDPSFQRFAGKVSAKNGEGGLFLNTSLICTDGKGFDSSVYLLPASDMAYKLGDSRTANMIMLGGYAAVTGSVSRKSIAAVLKGPMTEINMKAFDAGFSYVVSQNLKDKF